MKKKFTIKSLHTGFILSVDGKESAVEKMDDIRKAINEFVYSCTLRADKHKNPIITIEIEETDNPPQVVSN